MHKSVMLLQLQITWTSLSRVNVSPHILTQDAFLQTFTRAHDLRGIADL